MKILEYKYCLVEFPRRKFAEKYFNSIHGAVAYAKARHIKSFFVVTYNGTPELEKDAVYISKGAKSWAG